MLPRWLLPTAAAVLAAAVAAAAWGLLRPEPSYVLVPSVRALEVPVARSRLAQLGLRLERGDERFSSEIPKGSVLEQRPKAGTKVRGGTAITVAVSAGTETFTMPDLLGEPLPRVKRLLAELGLALNVDVVESERPYNAVLQTTPGPGVRVRSGDVVRVAVSSGEASSSLLLPSDLSGQTFVLDPAPVPTSTPDATLETARRLRALLEASGARVLVTRSVTDSDTSVPARAARAAVPSGTALVGFEIASDGAGGPSVLSLPSSQSPARYYLGSIELARDLVLALQKTGERPVTGNAAGDAMLAAVPAPAVRLRLGVAKDSEDMAAFADPSWTDRVASAVYRALADRYGRR